LKKVIFIYFFKIKNFLFSNFKIIRKKCIL